MTECNSENSTIETQPQAQINMSALKEQLKNLSVEDRYSLLNSINSEERAALIRQQKQLAKDEEDKIAQCPLLKKVVSMNNELHELRMDLQKLKNKSNESTMKCPYSMFRINQINPISQDYISDADLCNELTETYTSSFSWWSTIMFIVFILFVLTAKPSKNCEQFFTTVM
jgi:hypothetical protein